MPYTADYSNDFVKSIVNRSKGLKCSYCDKPLPMKTKVVFELECGVFRGVFCMSCFEKDESMQESFHSQRHAMDLED